MQTGLRRSDDGIWIGSFEAMASPCEMLMELDERETAQRVLSLVSQEAWRVERKFSRYESGNIIDAINGGDGAPVEVDGETARLLDFANQLAELSEGRFDITSGVLRRAWTFDGSDRLPTREAVDEALRHVGWSKVRWDGRTIALEPGMQIDLGGIGKEYAVDRAAGLIAEQIDASCLVNFGGDLVSTRPRRNAEPWRVGIEDPSGVGANAKKLIRLTAGGLATSGDARRFLLKDGLRYGHILDPTTGWPVENAPRSITVAAGTCVQAGMIATLAMLEGAAAETFLADQDVRFWLSR